MNVSTWRERIARFQPYTLLAVTAGIAGLAAVFFGGAHYLFAGFPGGARTGLRLVTLQTIGSLQVFSGLLNLGAIGGLRRGEPLALYVSGLSTLYLLLFYRAVNPHFPDHELLEDLSLLIGIHTVHLALLVVAGIWKWFRGRRSEPRRTP
jgi:hypothetical protein